MEQKSCNKLSLTLFPTLVFSITKQVNEKKSFIRFLEL